MSASKPITVEAVDSKSDMSDMGFLKMDGAGAMANTATNFAAGVDKKESAALEKQNEIEALNINKINSIEEENLKRSGLEINVTPQVSISNRQQDFITVVEEEALATNGQSNPKLII